MKSNQKNRFGWKHILLSVFVLSAMLITFSCKKKDVGGYTNKLQFGESVNTATEGWPIVNEKYTFAEGATVHFRLETKDDFGSSAFKLIFKQGTTVVNTENYPSLQSYGHLYVSSFVIPSGVAGVYSIEAYVVTGNKLIDAKTLTITP